MASSELGGNFSMEEGSIDRDRIADGHLVPDEYFCPICQFLLWKPRSCSSCQHLFCEKCIRTWLESANSGNKCPFRCEPFVDRQCPPYIQSLLSRLNIRCRNSSLGCTQILPYNASEHHETVECEYLTQQCSECEKLVLVSNIDEHRQMTGLCIPCPIKCTICQYYVEKPLFLEHFHQCCQQRTEELNRITLLGQTLQAMTNRRPVVQNPGLEFIQTVTNTMRLYEHQKQMSRLPTSFKGLDAVTRARDQNCGHVYHILIMLKFFLYNWSKIPLFILLFGTTGFFTVGVLLLGGYSIFTHWAYKNIHAGFLIILLSFVLTYGTWIVFQLVSDLTIILSVGIFIFLCGCTSRISLELLETNPLFNRPLVNVMFCGAGIGIMKIILLLIRLYFWSMPIFMGAVVITLINFYFGWKIHCAYKNGIGATRNQPLLPV